MTEALLDNSKWDSDVNLALGTGDVDLDRIRFLGKALIARELI